MEFSSELPLFAKKAEKWISSLQSFISANFNISRRKQMLELSNELMSLMKNSGVIISTTFSTALHAITALILVPVFTFFFLFYRDFFESFLQKVFPKTEGQVLTKVMEKTGSVVQGYLVGLLVVMLIVGGVGSLWGSFAGAIFVVFVQEWLQAFVCGRCQNLCEEWNESDLWYRGVQATQRVFRRWPLRQHDRHTSPQPAEPFRPPHP